MRKRGTLEREMRQLEEGGGGGGGGERERERGGGGGGGVEHGEWEGRGISSAENKSYSGKRLAD